MWYIALLLFLASANAGLPYRRATMKLQGPGLTTFQNLFRTALAMQVSMNYNATMPMLAQLETDMTTCARTINDTRDSCMLCAVTMSRAGINYIGTGFESIGNGIAGWSGWNDMGDFFKGFGNGFTSWSGWGNMGDWFQGTGGNIAGWSGWNKMGNWFKGAGNSFKGGWNNMRNGFKDIGGGFVDVGKGIGGLFGQDVNGRWFRNVNNRNKRDVSAVRRAYISHQLRTIPDDARICMEKCMICEPFLIDQTTMITMICGESLVQRNVTLAARMHMLKAVYDAVVDDINIIVTKYDPMKFSPLTMAYTDVYITARINGAYVTYKSNVPYTVMDTAAATASMAIEFYNHWDTR